MESLRRSGVKVADTSASDMELDLKSEQGSDTSGSGERQEGGDLMGKFPLAQDHKILATDGSVRGWIAIPLDERDDVAGSKAETVEAKQPGEAIVQGEVMKGQVAG